MGKMLTMYENFKEIYIYEHIYVHVIYTYIGFLPTYICVCSTNASSVSDTVVTFYYINLLLFIRIL